MRRASWTLAAAAAAALAISPPVAAEEPDDASIEVGGDTTTIAQGVELDSFDRWEDQGWIRGDAATVDLSGVTAEYTSSGTVADSEPLRDQLEGHENTVLAFNADFFDINDTGGAEGAAITGGDLVKSADDGTSNVIAFDSQGRGSVETVGFSGTATADSGTLDLHGLNTTTLPSGEIGVYDAEWGSANLARTADGATETRAVTVVDGVVTATTDSPAAEAIPEGTQVLFGREEGARALAALNVGDAVAIDYEPVTEGAVPETAVSGRQLLIVDGEVVEQTDESRAPRTAVGFSADGETMYAVTVDGRQSFSGGYTLQELAEELYAMGAVNALNLDGGGSSTLIARSPGTEDLVTVNSPSDGSERSVGNGLAFTVEEGSGEPAGFAVEPQAAFDPGAIESADYDRVFPGLSRTLSVAAYDEEYGPAEASEHWTTSPSRSGYVDDDGVFHARGRSGEATVTARDGGAKGSTTLTVLGELDRIEPSEQLVSLSDAGSTGTFGVIGSDAEGYTAPIDPVDVELEYDHGLLAIESDGEGGFTVTPKADSGSGTVEITVAGKTTALAVTVGLEESTIADFSDASEWTFSTARATGSMAPGEGHGGSDGLTLTYDFSQSTATRAAYATPPESIAVEGQPQRFGMWIKAEGDGEWPSLHLKDADGTDVVLRGDYLTTAGWQWVEFEVPEGTSYPVSVYRFYVAETEATSLYQGSVTISDLTAHTAPDVEVPQAGPVQDDLVADDLDGSEWSFAVMSDAQFTGEDPDSAIVESARRTLREIKASDAEFLIINGDLVDECEADDLALAEQVLTEELGDEVEWVYVPGNHEVMGCDISDWSDVFGDAYQVFDRGGTRFITLDTSGLSLAEGGWDQIAMLREALDEAADDPSIDSVAVVAHVPPNDKSPQQASQLSDRVEAEAVEEWLTGFESDSGKEAVYIGAHAGYFDASSVDGVSYWVNGNSGKAPSTTPEDGGFVGWTEFGVGGDQWLSALVHPQVDALAVDSGSLARGETVTVGAELTQGDTAMGVAYPMGATWSASGNVYVGERPPNPLQSWRYDAWFNPSTQELTAWRTGTVEVTATVNGTTATGTYTVTRG